MRRLISLTASCDIIITLGLGGPEFTAAQCDFDGDSITDPMVYREANGYWAGLALSRQYAFWDTSLGETGYQPVMEDYDGDGLADPAIYKPSTAEWQVLMSGSLATQGVYTWCDGFLGTIGGIPVPADYDGDGRADPAVYHQDTGLWELFPSTKGYQLYWGLFGSPQYQPVSE